MIMTKVEFSTFNSQKEMKLPEYVLRISKVYRIILHVCIFPEFLISHTSELH